MAINVPASGLLTINVTAPEAVTLVEWDFGDGSTGTGMTATHDYAAPGDYIVTLTVTLPDGTTDTSQSLVTVTDPLLLDVDIVSGALVDQSSYAVAVSPTPGSTYTTGRNSGEALAVDATHGIFVNKSDIPQLYLLDELSLYMGLKVTTAGDVVKFNTLWSVSIDSSGEVVADFTNTDSTNYQVMTSGAGLLDGQWHDITVVWQGFTDGVAGGSLTVYVDGVEAVSTAVTGTTKTGNRDLWCFGVASASSMVGEMDHLRFHGVAQTAAEVATEHGAV